MGDRAAARADGGAQLAFTFQGERIEGNVRELAASVDAPLVTACDVRSDDDIERVFDEVGEAFGGKLDLLVHSVAFAAAEDLEGRFTDTPRDRFWMALDISAYSLVALRARGRAADGGGRRRLDRDDDLPRRRARRAALQRDGRREGDARLRRSSYLAWDLGEKNIRVNAISAGPVRTLAARSIAGFHGDGVDVRRAARRCAATSTPTTSAAASAYLLSDEAKNVTGTTLYVDSGYHAMGM